MTATRMTPTDFAEKRLMPLVFAFALGVLAALEAGERQAQHTRVIALQAIDVAHAYAEQCGPIWPPADIPEPTQLARRP